MLFKKLFSATIKFIKKWGIFGVIGYISIWIPLGLGYLLGHQDLKTTGWVIVAVATTPNGIGTIATILLAAIYKWLWNIPILGFIAWGKETVIKVQTQTQLMLYYDSDEIKMLLDHGKDLKKYTDDKKKRFFDNLKKERIKKIDEQWSKENRKDEHSEID